jgi:hypothetical protein
VHARKCKCTTTDHFAVSMIMLLGSELMRIPKCKKCNYNVVLRIPCLLSNGSGNHVYSTVVASDPVQKRRRPCRYEVHTEKSSFWLHKLLLGPGTKIIEHWTATRAFVERHFVSTPRVHHGTWRRRPQNVVQPKLARANLLETHFKQEFSRLRTWLSSED